MSKYPDDIREKALQRTSEIGVERTAREMHIGRETLYRWKNEQRTAAHSSETTMEEDDKLPTEQVSSILENIRLPNIEKTLRSELEDMQRLDHMTAETIDYLIAENRQLRQRCERYLKALSLLAQ